MDNKFYTTIENQIRDNGTYGLLYDHFYEEEGKAPALDRAYAKYFTVCAAAAVSTIPYHAVYLLDSNGTIVDQKVWDRRTPAQGE